MRLPRVLACVFLLASFAIAATSEQSVIGNWSATISPVSKTGEKLFDAKFHFIVEKRGSALHGVLVNGPERTDFTSAQFADGVLKLALVHYDGVVTLKVEDNGELSGDYTRQTSTGIRHYPIHAVRDSASKAEAANAALVSGPSLEGEWIFDTPTDSGSDKIAPAVFHREANSNAVSGTIAPVSGDLGLLAGEMTKGSGNLPTFSLSRFDGIHVLLLEGQFDTADTLHGTLNKSTKFTAVRKGAPAVAAETVPDAESITKVKNPTEVFQFKGVDPKTGKTVTQDDFKGKPVIVDIFGTWCPNCHDEAPLLEELYSKYKSQGLEIVGLAYEYTDDAPHNAKLVDIYRKKFNIGFPLLVSGTTAEGQIAATLPALVGFGAYPTTIFIGRDGRVQRIHAGFSGPATGKLEEVRKRFDENVRALVGGAQ